MGACVRVCSRRWVTLTLVEHALCVRLHDQSCMRVLAQACQLSANVQKERKKLLLCSSKKPDLKAQKTLNPEQQAGCDAEIHTVVV